MRVDRASGRAGSARLQLSTIMMRAFSPLRRPIMALTALLAAVAPCPGGDVHDADLNPTSHWAYQPVSEPAIPDVQSDWPASPVDVFVSQRLQERGLSPSTEADRRTLLRRAHFALTGLPPSMAEQETFFSDTSPGAFERLVDRLLDSPAYGQHWARHWLDVARYADTKGYVFTENTSYPYAYTFRDYVIDAFNEDVPFDQFILEQLAADLLPTPRNDRAIAALGFLTVGRRFNKNIHDILDDRIDVITRGFLGLTVACARCHDHKYDPIPTADYYSLYGVMASCREPGELPYVGDPTRHEGYARFQAGLRQRRKKADRYLRLQHALLLAESRERVDEYLNAALARMQGQPSEETPGHLKPGILDRWQSFLEQPTRLHDPVFRDWVRLSRIPADEFASAVMDECDRLVKYARSHPQSSSLLLSLAIREGRPQSMADVTTILGQMLRRADSIWIAFENPWLATADLPLNLIRAMETDVGVGRQGDTAHGVSSETIDRAFADLKHLQRFLYASDSPIHVRRDEARRHFDVPTKQHLERLQREADEFEVNSPDAPPRAMVVADRRQPAEPRIFRRGSPSNPGEVVPRQFLSVLAASPRTPFKHGSGRLELARAIASPQNPLTARVIVNRVWQHHFGRGLVRTPSNFGAVGERPSHPRLLDWLAWQFMEHDWSLKWLHRQIMISSTYRQQSELRADGYDLDPENRLLWRQNRQRLGFEPMRDAMLSWAGRLDLTHGGQPFALGRQPSVPRRTIYGKIDRQKLYGPLRYFDVASPDASAAARPQTTVPQQALFLINSPFMAEQARHTAERITTSAGEARDSQIELAYRLILAREPSTDELRRAEEFFKKTGRVAASDSSQQLAPLAQFTQILMVSNEAVFVD